MTIKMIDETMKPERALNILARTNAAAALDCAWYHVLEENPNLRYSEVRDIVDDILTPVSEYLMNPIKTNDQFVAAPRNLDYTYGLIERNGSLGQRIIVDHQDADSVFRNRSNFGAQSIDEFLTAVVVAADHTRETFETPEVEKPVTPEVDAPVYPEIEKLKAEIKAALKEELKAEIKAEIKEELEAEKAPVRAEASAKLDQLLAQYRKPIG